jgi:pyruvate formate lyase activating enzyme
MIFGGIQKNSLIDYPGMISSVLFVSGCNFTCPYCHNPELVKDKFASVIHPIEVLSFLAQRKQFLDGVVITGGEPTLQKNLIPFIKEVRRIGYRVKIDTNGSQPHVVDSLVSKSLVDYIAMDVKTIPDDYAPYIQKKATPDKIKESIQIILRSNLPHEFRTTCVKPFVNKTVVKKIAQLIQHARLYVLQPFNARKVLMPDFFPINTEGFTKSQLSEFQSIAQPWVKKCMIR